MKNEVADLTQADEHPPLIVLMEKKAVVDHDLLKQWLGANGYLALDAVDIFDALEEIADFTVEHRPDVILLEVSSLAEDFQTIRGVIDSRPNASHQPIFALSDGDATVNHQECFEGDVHQLKARLDKIIPERNFAYSGSF